MNVATCVQLISQVINLAGVGTSTGNENENVSVLCIINRKWINELG